MPLVSPVTRTTIFVRDMERSLAFYRDLLDLEVVADVEVPNPGISEITGVPCRSGRIVVLSAGSQTGNIGLAELRGPAPPLEDPPPPERLRLGETCLVIKTASLDEVLERIRDLPRLSPVPVALEIAGRGTVHEFIIRDPDGVLINLSAATETSPMPGVI